MKYIFCVHINLVKSAVASFRLGNQIPQFHNTFDLLSPGRCRTFTKNSLFYRIWRKKIYKRFCLKKVKIIQVWQCRVASRSGSGNLRSGSYRTPNRNLYPRGHTHKTFKTIFFSVRSLFITHLTCFACLNLFKFISFIVHAVSSSFSVSPSFLLSSYAKLLCPCAPLTLLENLTDDAIG